MFFLFRFPPASLPEDLQANSVNPVLEPWDEVVSEPIDEQDQALEAPHEVRDIEVIKGASVALPTEPVARPHKLVTPRPAATPLKKSQRSVTTGTDASVNGQATLQVFGNEARGNKFVFRFDRSISMEGSPLSTAKSQLVANLALLKNSHAFQIVFFSHEPETWDPKTRGRPAGRPRLVNATQEHRLSAQKFVPGITASGGTYRRSALAEALQMRADVIFFLTDADAPMAGSDVLEAVRLARHQHTAIHTIEFGAVPFPTRENFLVELARRTQGRYVYINASNLD